MSRCGIVLLAAGSSSRLGRPKQLLSYHGRPLLQHTIDAIAATTLTGPAVVVYGAHASAIIPHIDHHTFHTVTNMYWAEGIASSIRYGLSAIQALSPYISRVLFLLADQPFITPSLLSAITGTAVASPAGIIASHYDDAIGTPVLFHSKYFAALHDLNGDEGARKLIKNNMHDVHTVSFPMGHIDIDTIAQYTSLAEQAAAI